MSEFIIIANSERLNEATIDAINKLGHATIVAGDAMHNFAMAIGIACCDIPVAVYTCGMPASYDWMIHDALTIDPDHRNVASNPGDVAVLSSPPEEDFFRGLVDIGRAKFEIECLADQLNKMVCDDRDYYREYFVEPKIFPSTSHQTKLKRAYKDTGNFEKSGFRSSGRLARGRI